jgi:hypothetical protein
METITNIEPRVGRVLPAQEIGRSFTELINQYDIQMNPKVTTEGGYDFKADYCFDEMGKECPFFDICGLLIKNSNKNSEVFNARVNFIKYPDLSAETQKELESRRINPKTNKMETYRFTMETIRKTALCTHIKELDPIYYFPKEDILHPEPKSPLPIEGSKPNRPRYAWQDAKNCGGDD